MAFFLKPSSLDSKSWNSFAILFATLLGIILRPLPMGAIAFLGLCVFICSGIPDIEKDAFSAFSSPVVWLIIFVFFIAHGLIKTQLSNRIAYLFVYFFGKKTLGLGYSLILTELIIAPAIPSNAARMGGIILPILKSISNSLGSSPEDGTEKKLGAFLTQVCFQGNLITSAMFLTAAATNSVAQTLAAKQGVYISWSTWLLASSVPGILSIIIMPLVLYVIYSPQIKKIPEASLIAKQKLQELGSIKRQEWIVMIVLVTIILFWIFGETYNLNPSTVALLGVCLLLITKVLTWEEIVRNHEAWNTLIWLSILIMLSEYLEKLGIINYFSNTISNFILGWTWYNAFFFLTLAYFYSHYFLAGNIAHVSAMYATFLSSLIVAGAPAYLAALMLMFLSNLFSSMTHYGTPSASILYGAGYVPLLIWWKIGLIVSFINILIWLGIGSIWLKILGFW